MCMEHWWSDDLARPALAENLALSTISSTLALFEIQPGPPRVERPATDRLVEKIDNWGDYGFTSSGSLNGTRGSQ